MAGSTASCLPSQYECGGQLWGPAHRAGNVDACALRSRKAKDLSQATSLQPGSLTAVTRVYCSVWGTAAPAMQHDG